MSHGTQRAEENNREGQTVRNSQIVPGSHHTDTEAGFSPKPLLSSAPGIRALLLFCLVAGPLSATVPVPSPEQLPTWPPVHTMVAPYYVAPSTPSVTTYSLDEAPECAATCSNEGTAKLAMAPSIAWTNVTVDLVYAWMRAGVLKGTVPSKWGYVPPDSAWTKIYPTVHFCSNKFMIEGVSGTSNIYACAHSAAGFDTLTVALENPSQAKARIAWESCNAVLFYHLENWTLSDGTIVANCTDFVAANNP